MMNPCGECSECCKACNITEIEKPSGVLCWLYEEGKGCSINETKPSACKSYQCLYITQTNIDEKYRPDKLRVIFEQPLGKSIWVGIELEEGALQTEDCKTLVRAMNNDGAAVMLKDLNGKLQHSLPPDVDLEWFKQQYMESIT